MHASVSPRYGGSRPVPTKHLSRFHYYVGDRPRDAYWLLFPKNVGLPKGLSSEFVLNLANGRASSLAIGPF